MKLGFYIIVTILFSAIVSGVLLDESGYITIYYSSYVIEMSLVVFFILNVIFLSFLILLSKIKKTPSHLINTAQNYKRKNANSLIEKSYLNLLQGCLKNLNITCILCHSIKSLYYIFNLLFSLFN